MILTAITTQIENVKQGDSLCDYIVETIKTGTKWVEVRDAAGTLIARSLIGTEVVVNRLMPTEEEIAAKKAETQAELIKYSREQLHDMHQKMVLVHGQAKVDMMKALENGQTVTPSMMDRLVKTQVIEEYAVRITDRLNDGMDILEIFSLIEEKIKEELVEGYGQSHWSGGFTFQNAIEQTKTDAKRELLRSIKWMHISI